MRHIVDEVIFHLRHLFLTEYHIYRKDKSDKQNDGKGQCRNHHPCRFQQIGIHIRKMNPHNADFTRRVITEQHLGV